MLVWSLFGTIGIPTGIAEASIEDASCVVEPTTSSGTQSGVTAVAVGETVRLGTEVPFDAGTIYQDVLAHPDGSTYYASWLGVSPAADSVLDADVTSLTLTIDGVEEPLIAGTEPSPSGFVVDTTTSPIRVYFPGDPDAMLAEPSGSGVPSYDVPAPGQTFRLTYLATVPDIAPGEVSPAVTCQGAISLGDENVAISARTASVATLGLDLHLAKSANVPVLAPSTTATYSIDVSVPEFDEAGEIRTGTAYDTVVTDTLPPGLEYVEGSASHEGSEADGVITWTVSELAADDSLTLTYQLRVPDDAPIGTEYTNSVAAETTSQPGEVSGERTFTADGDSVTLTNGADAPAIDKTVDVSNGEPGVAGTGQEVPYEVEITWPAGSTWYDVTITDLLPDGMTLVDAGSFTCAPVDCPALTELEAYTDTTGRTRFGHYIDELGPFDVGQTWTWTYTARMEGAFASGDAVPPGTTLDNLAEVRFNLVPRMGGVLPNLSRLNEYDGLVGDTDPVVFDRPVIAIDKAAPTPTPVAPTPDGVTYSVTLTNTGAIDASDVAFTDPGPAASDGRRLGTIDPGSVSGATYHAGTGTFTVPSIPAGGDVTVTYAVVGSPDDTVTVDAEYANTATVAGYEDPAGNTYTESPSDVAALTVAQPVLALDKERLSTSPIAGTDGEAISYRVTVVNTSDVTAYAISGADTFEFDGVLQPGDCTGGLGIAADGTLTLDELAPDASADCEYAIALDGDQPVGSLTNSVTITWENGFGQTGTWDPDAGVIQPWEATDSTTTEVVHPQLALQKSPDADTPGNTIANGQVSTYTITLANVSAVPAPNVLVDDVLPDGLTLEAAPTVDSNPAGIEHTVTGGAGDAGFQVDVPELASGASLQITVPVRHDGNAPDGDDHQLVNTVTVTADGMAEPLQDTGVLVWVPDVELPVADKTVEPTSAEIGEQVTWTVTATVPENTVDLYDVAFVDTLPDGLTFDAYGAVSCVGPLCGPDPAQLAPAVLPSGETRIGWFVGDVPAGTGESTYTFSFTATVASEYTGEGTPPAGTPLTDIDLDNLVQPWLTLAPELDRYDDGSRPDLGASNLNTQFEWRAVPVRESLHVTTPKVTADKQVANRGEIFEWDTGEASGAGWTASAGDEITYEVTFANTGTGTAYDIVATDSMGQPPSGAPMLRDVEVTGLPAGVTVQDGWTLADPAVVFQIDELAADESVTVTYTGVVAPSEELVPGFSGDNRDIALIDNTLTIDEFRSAPDGGGRLFDGSFETSAQVYIYTPSAWIPFAAACVGGSDAPAGTTGTFFVTARNGAPPAGERTGTLLTTGFPPDGTVGVGEDATLTIELSPDLRYVEGSARSGGSSFPDPATTLDDATSVQTLVFDLGDMPQDSSIPLTFDVRTTGFGVQGGMGATLAMDDASGSPSRGTAVSGAAYPYQHRQSRGCAPTRPLQVTKVPDQSADYDGQKAFEVGESVQWSGGVSGSGAPYHDGELIDTMPDGIDYVPGSAVFTVDVPGTGTVVVSAANGNLTEEVTPLPDGRTELHFTSPVFAEFNSMRYRLDSVVADDAIVGGTLTNVIELIVSDVDAGSCANPTAAVCDNGQVRIISSEDPTIQKSVDHTAGPWGDTFDYTVDVTFPATMPLFDTYIADGGAYPRALDTGTTFGGAQIQCTSGCEAGDPTPVMLPVYREAGSTADEFAVAWYLGDLTSSVEERVYRITYQQTFLDRDEYQAEFGREALNERFVNEAVTGWNDVDERDDANYQEGGAAHTSSSSRSFAFTVEERGLDDAAVDLVRPELAVDKACEALAGRDEPATSTSLGGETSGSVPNFRCVLTATNTTDPAVATAVVDPVFTDALPTVSDPGDRPVTTQVISTTPTDPLLVADVTEDPDSDLTPPAATSIQFLGSGIELDPGESVSVTVDLRVSADDAFWEDDTLIGERSVNTVSADSYADGQANEYAGDSTDQWNLVVEKPRLTVSERAFAPGEYEGSLADPTACLAYASRAHDPPSDTRNALFAPRLFNACTNLLPARLHDTTPGGDYARAYGGYGYGAPDVIPGVTDTVTWAVDTAVVDADAFSTVSITDQIPYGFEYVPGSARLAHWSEAGTSHTPLADPSIGASPDVSCTSQRNFSNDSIANGGIFVSGHASYGQLPWTPLTWNFAPGAEGAAGAFWSDDLAYLNEANRDAARAQPDATSFDRMVRVVFDVRPTAEFADCLETPQRANTFRSQVDATGTYGRGSATSTGLGWVVGVELAQVDKTPDAGIAPDGTTANYDIGVTITDNTRLQGDGFSNVSSENACSLEMPESPIRTPWLGLGDLGRNTEPVTAAYGATPYGDGFRSQLVVTDTLVDDGQYVPGSATFEMFDPWGRPFAGHLASEEVETVTVDGREASRITWTFDYYPSPVNVGRSSGRFPCQASSTFYVTFPSSMHISVPLPIPDGTPDGTLHPNTAQVTTTHHVDGELVRSDDDADDALITVRNPSPPPPATKTAVPDEVAPGAPFDWVVEAQLDAGRVWFDLGWTDTIPASMEFLDYGTPTCVVTGTATPCPAVDPTLLTPVRNPDGSTTVGWFVGDVLGSGTDDRTLRLPLHVRFTGDEVAGDTLSNDVTGYSNEEDTLDEPTEPADPADFTYTDSAVGTATVVEPNLEITKAVSNGPGPFQVGDTVSYEVSVTNTGGATAYDVLVSDTPDASLVDVTTAHPLRSKGWTDLDPRVEWFAPTVEPGETVVLDAEGVVDASYITRGVRELLNTATVPGYTSRPSAEEHARDYAPEQASVAVPLVAQNLTVDKYAGGDCTQPAQTYEPDEPVEWCVVVANTGDAAAHNVTLTDLLPAGWEYDTGSASVDGSPVEPDVSTRDNGSQRLEWTLGQVDPDAQHVITYRTAGDGSANLVANRAIANSTLEDGTPLTNPPEGFRSTGEAQAALLEAGLQISKLPNSQRFECSREDGCEVTWQIVVINADELDLTGATVTDYLPAGLPYESSTTPAGWSAATVEAAGSGPSGTTPITWTHPGTFASGDVASFEVTALVPPGADEREYLNHADAGANEVPTVENQALAASFAPASLGDFVWHDVDRDGRQDPGEPGIAGIAVQLYDAGGAGLETQATDPGVTLLDTQVTDTAGALLDTTVTDVDGRYLFAGLEPGRYQVRFLMPEGFQTSPDRRGTRDADSDAGADGRTAMIDLASGTDDLTWDAGLFEMPDEPPTTPDEDPAPEDPADPGTGSGSDGSGLLPTTGADLVILVLVGLVSMVAGWAFLWAGRRQRRRCAIPAGPG